MIVWKVDTNDGIGSLELQIRSSLFLHSNIADSYSKNRVHICVWCTWLFDKLNTMHVAITHERFIESEIVWWNNIKPFSLLLFIKGHYVVLWQSQINNIYQALL